VWQAYAAAVGGLLIPTVGGTFTRLAELLVSPQLWRAAWLSNQSLILGFSLSIIIGVPLGLLMGRFRGPEKWVDPYLNILLTAPMAAVIPLLIMSPLGLGLWSRVVLVVLFSIVMVVVSTRAGVRQVDPGLIEAGQCFGADELRLWTRVILPSTLPAIMTGIRLGLGRAITAMVIIELLMVAVGLGGMITEARGEFDPDALYAVVIFVVLEALVLVTVVRKIEARLVPWARESVLVN
jgi:NitT/TauT family transport system permease protein